MQLEAILVILFAVFVIGFKKFQCYGLVTSRERHIEMEFESVA